MVGRPCAATSGASASASVVLPAPSTPSIATRIIRVGCNATMVEARRFSSDAWASLTSSSVAASEHAGQHAVRRLVVVEEGPDIDDHLLAHLDAAFDRGRAHVRQQRDLAGLGQPNQFWIDGGLMLVDVEPGAADLATFD